MSTIKPKLTRRGLNSLQVSISYKGKRYRRSFREDAEAYRWIGECSTAANLDEPKLPEPRPPSYSAVQDMNWYEFLDHTENKVWAGSGATMGVIASKVAALKKYLPENFLTLPDQEGELTKLRSTLLEKYSRGYASSLFRYLEAVMKYALALGLIARVPKYHRITLSETDRDICLTPETVADMRSQALELGLLDLADFISVAVTTGMRPVEILDIATSDILGADRKVIRVFSRKTGKHRLIPLTDSVFMLLKNRSEGASGPFARYSYGKLIREWNILRSELGQDDETHFVPYILRHTYITTMLEKGVALPRVQKLAGHRRLSTTAKYIHMTDEDVDSVRDKLKEYDT